MKHRRFFRGLLVFSILLPSLIMLTGLSAFLSVKIQLKAQLEAHLPLALAESVRFSADDQQVLELVAIGVNADLATLEVGGLIALWQHCQARVQTLDTDTLSNGAVLLSQSLNAIQIPWSRAGRDTTAVLDLHCEPDVSTMLGFNGMIAFLLMMAIMFLPSTPERQFLEIRHLLEKAGYDNAQIGQVSEQIKVIPASAMPWLARACVVAREQSREIAWVLGVAMASDGVLFDHLRQRVIVHGIDLPLAKTPYFYFAWYALLRSRCVGDGWVLNPAPDRPSRAQAQLLMELMQSHGGHRKAINELAAHGLRGKLLDQNRNKIKDELAAVLGEALAEHDLFETARDLRSGRYRYRLRLPPEAIGVFTDVSFAKKRDIS